jgi:hypothetical protein
VTLPAWVATDEIEVLAIERGLDGSESLREVATLRGSLQAVRSRARRSGGRGHASVVGGVQLEVPIYVLYLPGGTQVPAGAVYRVRGRILWPVRAPAEVGGPSGHLEVELSASR